MIRYGRCTRMDVADFMFISLSVMSFVSDSYSLILFVLSLFYTSSLLRLSLCVSSSVCLFLFLSFSLSVTHTNTEVIISGRLGVKVCYDKHAAVVINFE